jgi:hypothetical protein
MRTILRIISLMALLFSLAFATTALEAPEANATVDSIETKMDDCAKKRARGKKCDDDDNRNGNRNGNSNSNTNSNGNRNHNSNNNGNNNANTNSNSNRDSNGNTNRSNSNN